MQVIDLACGEQIPKEVLLALEDETVIKWAFNATFERICLSRFLDYPTREYLDPESWRCSMVWAATMGLPLSLEGVGAVLGLEKQKLTEGKDLIKYFCQPCVPTKNNGQRTRNRPFHAPDKWAMFKKYNIHDVETEMGIQQRLAKFPVPAQVWEEYHMDQEINDRGVRLDMELVAAAIEMDTRSRTKLTKTMKKITELDNSNSVQQMKAWLSDNGLETDTLGKKAVAELLKSAPPKLSQVLNLRQQLAKSSVRKYPAMEKTVCADGRARGMFQFYGANRTGRFSGQFWWDVDHAVTEAVKYKHTTTEYGLTFSCRSGMLFITLPSGRNLAYVKPKLGTNKFGGTCITYEGIGPIGMVNDMYAESSNDEYKGYAQIATQRDFDAF